MAAAVRLHADDVYRVQGSEEDVPSGEEACGARAALYPEGPVRHRHRRLAEDSRQLEGMDEAVVRPQTGHAHPLQEPQAEGTQREDGHQKQQIIIFFYIFQTKLF